MGCSFTRHCSEGSESSGLYSTDFNAPGFHDSDMIDPGDLSFSYCFDPGGSLLDFGAAGHTEPPVELWLENSEITPQWGG